MSIEAKGIYPNWVNDKDIINQVLNDIIREGGRLPYTYVVNPDSRPEIKERMQAILEKMRSERLIHGTLKENDFLEIDVEGSRAVQFGYQKYKKVKKWDKFRYRSNRIILIISILIILGVIGFLIYFLMHYFKIL
jgi:hypothetical protein